MTGVLIKRRNLDIRDMQRKDAMKRYREKMATYQPKRETWKRSFPPRSQKERILPSS